MNNCNIIQNTIKPKTIIKVIYFPYFKWNNLHVLLLKANNEEIIMHLKILSCKSNE